ncbi:DUF2059 domain-containing protein [Hyunsoonleella sp. SJ7]|uniref:DUF2059 domain-containing protein n=1 Tax=Hyunsoonleella aquatilis TaxID=2762758 RepID=A0A923H8J0_9FLAO|nr:DUF2059 domain-containing protein [Hyunsoonleella aquatilis]MBC3758470.1 DUF2059 domain-containing protein [Hyunsoonleella aquatilis]
MKNSLLALVFIFTLSITAQESTDFKSETIEFIKITGATQAFETAISQLGAMVPEEKKEAYTKEAKGTLGGLYDKLADLYMAEFNQEEIKELVKFYKTELGKKLASKQVMLAQKGMLLGQTWGMEVQGVAQKYQ